MPAPLCYQIELPVGRPTLQAAVFIAPIAKQTSQPWPDEFPRNRRAPQSFPG
jgi:hypothetical protein